MNELPNIDFNDRHNTAQLQLTDSFRLNKQLQKPISCNEALFTQDLMDIFSIVEINSVIAFQSLSLIDRFK